MGSGSRSWIEPAPGFGAGLRVGVLLDHRFRQRFRARVRRGGWSGRSRCGSDADSAWSRETAARDRPAATTAATAGSAAATIGAISPPWLWPISPTAAGGRSRAARAQERERGLRVRRRVLRGGGIRIAGRSSPDAAIVETQSRHSAPGQPLRDLPEAGRGGRACGCRPGSARPTRSAWSRRGRACASGRRQRERAAERTRRTGHADLDRRRLRKEEDGGEGSDHGQDTRFAQRLFTTIRGVQLGLTRSAPCADRPGDRPGRFGSCSAREARMDGPSETRPDGAALS